jgi:hypothetical protein
VASFAASAKLTNHISLSGVEDILGSTGGGPDPASVRQREDKIFLTSLNLLTWSVQCLSCNRKPYSNNVFSQFLVQINYIRLLPSF